MKKQCGFNPTLVRLRRRSGGRSMFSMSCFNPTLVRLRQGQALRGSGPRNGFNPTLVRLRPAADGRVRRFGRDLFQSHAGSIEAHLAARARAGADLVSIPRWFD